ncbi:MAG: energy-coupling factor transporter transmembrane protein EcfT [Clostridia bacterium]|nr:energy-coupling factor transporter transmembrane protein EcfT [Clostridia bacterium]
MRDSAFHRCHPAVNFLYFAMAAGSAMLYPHPVHLGIGTACALGWTALLRGRRGVAAALRLAFPFALLVAILSPLANARGRDVLFRLAGRTITLQAVQTGLVSAGMLMLVILWFSLYAAVMTSDRFLHLFGRAAPSASLLVGMTLRLIPSMQDRLAAIRQARRGLRGEPEPGRRLRERVGEGMHAMTTLMTWSMEGAISTADAMKARGYGTGRRTAFSPFRFTRSDGRILALMMGLFGAVTAAHFAGYTAWTVYPHAARIGFSLPETASYLAFAALLSIPLWLEAKERLPWR